jgi:hypothetical protein
MLLERCGHLPHAEACTCHLFFGCFFIFSQILNCLSTNLIIKKNIIKIQKSHWMLDFFFFLLSRAFSHFTMFFFKKKTYFPTINLAITNMHLMKKLNASDNRFNIFGHEGKRYHYIIPIHNANKLVLIMFFHI